ncbi:FitA-like ribbon-helix-helix domain-containing protein [Mycolicibacterium neworleansense]|uniref:Antitoxin n=1 Tax=Mycolicibacterium neworleansense TaxID=146018 RepID=A0A0H5RS19_9MYCO|nr:Arc family DNA-binding protein [Mycolicibacterium neworleansense]MCV7361596.1 Arc family DNA-binding protein [Mycolicibacterium neworleansense]CRZ16950.1 antitoxin [Mycolicibacterium neworleansense]
MVAITIRDVPDEVRDTLTARAARNGRSLQEYLLAMLIDAATKPTVDEVLQRARGRVEATGTRLDIPSILTTKNADE